MFTKIIKDLKDISAEYLLQNKCQPYAEGVLSALSEYNAFVQLKDAKMLVRMRLAQAYSDKEYANNNAEKVFQTGKIDFFEYILDYKK